MRDSFHWRESRAATALLVGLAACGDAPAPNADAGEQSGVRDGGASVDAGGSEPERETRPYDPTGQEVGFTLALGDLDPIWPIPEPATNPDFGGQVGRGFGIDDVDGERPFRRVLASFSMHDDIASAPQLNGVVASTDGARTFGELRSGIEEPPTFAIELRDGRVSSYGFVPTARRDVGGETELTLDGSESLDRGLTWRDFAATVTVPRMAPGLGRVSGHPIQLADGTILLPYYLAHAGDRGTRAELLESSDGGATFVRRASIAVPSVAGVSYPEPDIVKLADGTLYSVFRHHVGTTLSHLLTARSSDDGRTWSAPEPLRVSFGGAAASRIGINPQLMLMPNGALVLSSGRPDNWVAISTSGDGVEWRDATVTYVNHPSATSASYGAAVLRYHGSSGNTGLVGIDSTRFVQIGDNCANGWGCPPADRGYHVDNRYRVWRRLLEVASPDVGKIDLLSKVAAGRVRVTTDMVWSHELHPRAGVEGAFDGSTDYWSSAVAATRTGTMTLDLDRRYDLTRVGLSIRRGVAASAVVLASTDGESWTEIARVANRAHEAMEYVALPGPAPARHVRVEVENDGACDGVLGEACAFLNELELYSTIDSFENDPAGAPPRGYVETASAWVTDYDAGDTRRALRIVDSSDSVIARAIWNGTPGADKHLEFSVRPIALPGGFLFSIRGRDSAGAIVTAYHFAVMPDGALARYDFAAATWTPLTAAGRVPLDIYTSIRVEADLEGATIFVGDERIVRVSPSEPGAVAIDSHAFSSSGTRPTGDHVLVDDVYFQ